MIHSFSSINTPSIIMPSLKKSHFLLIVILGFLLSMIFRAESDYTLMYYISNFIGISIMFSIFILPLKYIVYPIYILITTMPDITQSFEGEEILVASLWQISLGPITPALFIYFFLLVVIFRLFTFTRLNSYKVVLLYFLIIPTLTSLFYGFLNESIFRFIADAKVPIFFIGGLLLFSSYYRKFPRELIISCQVFLALALGNFILDTLKLFFNNSDSISLSVNNLSFDSAKGLITIFTFWGIAKIVENKNLTFSIITIIITMYLMFAYQTRWLIVTFIFGLFLITTLQEFKKMFNIFLSITLVLIMLIPIIKKFTPEVIQISLLRFSFLENLSKKSTLMDIDVVRAGSIYNSLNLLWEKNAFLTGMGYGSWYNDSNFPMPNLTTSAFDEESLRLGKYYRIHDFFFHFLFKFGLIGVWLYIEAFVKPLRQIWKFRQQIRKNFYSLKVSIMIFGLSPLVITYMYWTGKGLLISALYIVITYEWVKYFANVSDNKKCTVSA